MARGQAGGSGSGVSEGVALDHHDGRKVKQPQVEVSECGGGVEQGTHYDLGGEGGVCN